MGARRGRDPLLLELVAELGKGEIIEDFIRSQGDAWIEGCVEEGRVWVNPAPNVVEIVFHELCHKLYPAWKERTVLARSRRLLRCLTDAEVQRVFEIYQRVAKKVKRRGRRSA